jgi:hypothetical protein
MKHVLAFAAMAAAIAFLYMAFSGTFPEFNVGRGRVPTTTTRVHRPAATSRPGVRPADTVQRVVESEKAVGDSTARAIGGANFAPAN